MSDATIRFSHYALYPVFSDDGQRMWASRPQGKATNADVVFDSDLALIEQMASELAARQAMSDATDYEIQTSDGVVIDRERVAAVIATLKARLAEVEGERDKAQAVAIDMAISLVKVEGQLISLATTPPAAGESDS